MKTKELLALLKKCDKESEVSFQMRSGCCGDVEYMEVTESDIVKIQEKKHTESWLVITFASLPGYRTCIQSGNTVSNDEKYCEKFNILEKK